MNMSKVPSLVSLFVCLFVLELFYCVICVEDRMSQTQNCVSPLFARVLYPPVLSFRQFSHLNVTNQVYHSFELKF